MKGWVHYGNFTRLLVAQAAFRDLETLQDRNPTSSSAINKLYIELARKVIAGSKPGTQDFQGMSLLANRILERARASKRLTKSEAREVDALQVHLMAPPVADINAIVSGAATACPHQVITPDKVTASSDNAQYTWEKGMVVSDPLVVREMERRGLGIGTILGLSKATPNNAELSRSPQFAPVYAALKKEFVDYQRSHRGSGIGTRYAKRLFDISMLTSPKAHFTLVGVVNRMDRAFVNLDTCGEIRLIYRLEYETRSHGEDLNSRYPMTVNVILHARPKSTDGSETMSCSELAQRWLNTPATGKDPARIADRFLADSGPVGPSIRNPGQIDKLETNMQLVRWPAAIIPDLGSHAEYLLKVFQWNDLHRTFAETTLENQIDRERFLRNPELLKEFKTWLNQPEHLKELDEGTLVIPEKYLARRAITTSPGGMAQYRNRPFDGLFSQKELDQLSAEIEKNHSRYVHSALGIMHRLNDISCSGCHQTRSVAGFHFVGKDPFGEHIANATFVAESPHMLGDLPRRQNALKALANGQKPDLSRGFSARPDRHGLEVIAGSGLLDGWGATCSTSQDPSFKSWTCASGLECKAVFASSAEPGFGICLPNGRQEVGDPIVFGKIVGHRGIAHFIAESRDPVRNRRRYTSEPQMAHASNKTGGFPGGMIHLRNCKNLPPEAVCGPLPGSSPGFNDCIASGGNFDKCLIRYSDNVGLRGCDKLNPCRDDYICAGSNDMNRGACVPPYFLFQLRVDGHPKL